ncbi:MAG: hypothetical protein M3124_02705 [Actinomycetota bacterium]|nr:hypothetical protein [Actinomycetota bacterium]
MLMAETGGYGATSPPQGSDRERRIDVDMDSNCRVEVRRLHDFFVEWFNDDPEHPRVEFAYVEGVLHPDFSMVLPSGVTIDRTVALEQIRAAHASATGPGDVAIEIVDHSTLAVAQDAALVSYQERQFSAGVMQNARISTAYFIRALDAPHGVQWYRLHETLLAADGGHGSRGNEP